MTTVGNGVFIDTNVLVAANVAEAPFHQESFDAIRNLEDTDTELWISRQVIREYLATLSRTQVYTRPLPSATLIQQVKLFQSRFRVAEDSQQVTDQLLSLLSQFAVGGKQIHDANIVATMRAYGLSQLLTHNTADFSRFSSVITLLPL